MYLEEVELQCQEQRGFLVLAWFCGVIGFSFDLGSANYKYLTSASNPNIHKIK